MTPINNMRSGQPGARIRRWTCGLAVASMISIVGCENAGQGALSGAAIGAGSGAAISAIGGGNPGTGAAIGAIGGAVVGGIIGDQNERNADRDQE